MDPMGLGWCVFSGFRVRCHHLSRSGWFSAILWPGGNPHETWPSINRYSECYYKLGYHILFIDDQVDISHVYNVKSMCVQIMMFHVVFTMMFSHVPIRKTWVCFQSGGAGKFHVSGGLRSGWLLIWEGLKRGISPSMGDIGDIQPRSIPRNLLGCTRSTSEWHVTNISLHLIYNWSLDSWDVPPRSNCLQAAMVHLVQWFTSSTWYLFE